MSEKASAGARSSGDAHSEVLETIAYAHLAMPLCAKDSEHSLIKKLAGEKLTFNHHLVHKKRLSYVQYIVLRRRPLCLFCFAEMPNGATLQPRHKRDTGMLTNNMEVQNFQDEGVFDFFEDENDMYNLQISVLQKNLIGAPDVLSNYTCHSQPHIREVMQQAVMLFNVLREWLVREIGLPQEKMQKIQKHLLLAAKFHDVGMAGSPALRRLLFLADELHDRCMSYSSFQQQSISEFESWARMAEAECSHWGDQKSLCGNLFSKIVYGDPWKDNLCQLFELYHELVKQTIRKYHGEISARWIIQNQAVLSERYGKDINWNSVALMAALHTGSLLRRLNEKGTEKDWQAYCSMLCSFMNIDASFLNDTNAQGLFLALTSILRLADQRRSGSKLLTLDRNEVRTTVATDGRLRMEYAVNGITRHPDISESNSIIVAEKLNEFGSIEMGRYGNKWTMKHNMLFSHTSNEFGRRLLIKYRIPSYVKELQNSLFQVAPNMRHIFSVSCSNSPGKKQSEEPLLLSVDDVMVLCASPFSNQQTWIAKTIDERLQKYCKLNIEIVP